MTAWQMHVAVMHGAYFIIALLTGWRSERHGPSRSGANIIRPRWKEDRQMSRSRMLDGYNKPAWTREGHSTPKRHQTCVTASSLAQQLCPSHQFLWFIAYLPLSLDEPAAIRAAVRYPDPSISLHSASLARIVLFLPRSFWRSWTATPPGEAVPKATWA